MTPGQQRRAMWAAVVFAVVFAAGGLMALAWWPIALALGLASAAEVVLAWRLWHFPPPVLRAPSAAEHAVTARYVEDETS